MKQNKDREEFEKLMNNLAHTVKDNKTASAAIHTIWSWIQSYTQKKVEEERETLLNKLNLLIDKKFLGEDISWSDWTEVREKLEILSLHKGNK